MFLHFATRPVSSCSLLLVQIRVHPCLSVVGARTPEPSPNQVKSRSTKPNQGRLYLWKPALSYPELRQVLVRLGPFQSQAFERLHDGLGNEVIAIPLPVG